MIDWSKAMEVFGSGIIGVYLIMGLLMVLTQIGLKVVDYIEAWNKRPAPEQAQ
ncbi:MAG: hypothetical protein NDI77_07120 [Geobacteraceae bacterium]|nr:hypothetical protein [Geobacteraceae bacterium]